MISGTMISMLPLHVLRVLGPAAALILGASPVIAGFDEPTTTPPNPTTPTSPVTPIPTPPRGPVLRPPRVDSPTSIEPVRPNLPDVPARELGLPVNPPLVREGAFVSSARGQLVRGKSGRPYFIFDRDATGRTFPPMILVEGPNLASMERLAEAGGSNARLRIGGQVLVYRGRNYLLVTTPPLMERLAEQVSADTTPSPREGAGGGQDGSPTNAPATTPPQSAPSTPPGERSIDDIIADLDKAVGPRANVADRRPVQSVPSDAAPGASGPDAALNSAPTGGVMDSRSLGYLASRRGRLVRASDGWLMFRPDTGANSGGGGGKTEPAMNLLPCQNLMALETIAETAGESTTLTMSGEVMVYQGRHFLLPSMYVVNRVSGNVLPTQ